MSGVGNVIGLRPDLTPLAPGEPVEIIVECLEKALAEAKNGNIRAISICYVIEDGTETKILSSSTHWEPGYIRHLYYATARQVRRIEKEIDG